MDRIEIKNQAKEKIKGNIWDILWPALVIMVLAGAIQSLFGGHTVNININNLQDLSDLSSADISSNPVSIVSSIIIGILNAGYIKYLLTFIRKNKFDTSEIINTIKDKWLDLLIANILVTLIVAVCTLLLVVPGIIMGIAYSFVNYLIIDKDIKGNEALKKSREMMKGYKLDYFIFQLSFIGWFILSIFTLGILLIWLFPYYVVANVLYYEKLQERVEIK